MPPEPEVLAARLPWFQAQDELTGVPLTRDPMARSLGWFGTSVLRERGAFALVRRDGPLAELVGDRLKITYGEKVIYVYCVATAGAEDVSTDVGVTRRAYLALDLPAFDQLVVTVEAVSG